MNSYNNKMTFNVGIIAAGEGKRFKEEGVLTPKPLIEINGVPIIKRLIESAYGNGASSVICIINEESKTLEKYLTEIYYSKPFKLIVKSTPSSFHSFYEITQFLKPPFLLTTTDSVFRNEEFTEFLNYSMNINKSDAVIAVTEFIDDEKPLYVTRDNDSRIISFTDTDIDNNLITGGLYFFKKDIHKEAEQALSLGISRLRNFLRFLVGINYKLSAFSFSKIIDVDHLSDIEKAEAFLKEIE